MNPKEKQMQGLEKRLKNGQLNNKPPAGYKYQFDINSGKSIVIIDEEKALIIKHCFELYSSGLYSLKSIHSFVLETYNFKISKTGLSNILCNQFYIGINIVNGISYAHNFTPIINIELFNKVQETTKKNIRRSVRKINPLFLLQKLFRCEICNSLFTPDIKKNKYIYYFCSNYKLKHEFIIWSEKDLLSKLNKIISNEIGISIWDLFERSPFIEKRIILNYIFKELKVNNSSVIYNLNKEDFSLNSIENYIKTNRELIVKLKENKLIKKDILLKKDYENIYLNLCKDPQSIDQLVLLTGINVISIQDELIDLQLQDKIIENENGTWQTVI